MNCKEFQQVLPDIVDGGHSAEQRAHLKSCAACSGLMADLNAIVEQAHTLVASEEPSPRVWNAIEIALRREGLIRSPQTQPDRSSVPGFWSRWQPAMLLPLAAALMIAVGLLVYRPAPGDSGLARNHGALSPTVSDNGADTDDQQLLAEVSRREPDLRAAYEDNLKNVNASIQDAEDSVKANPADDELQHFLRDAYEQKAMLYQMAMDNSLP